MSTFNTPAQSIKFSRLEELDHSISIHLDYVDYYESIVKERRRHSSQ